MRFEVIWGAMQASVCGEGRVGCPWEEETQGEFHLREKIIPVVAWEICVDVGERSCDMILHCLDGAFGLVRSVEISGHVLDVDMCFAEQSLEAVRGFVVYPDPRGVVVPRAEERNSLTMHSDIFRTRAVLEGKKMMIPFVGENQNVIVPLIGLPWKASRGITMHDICS